MFDTFDLLVPALVSIAGIDIRQRESAFGLDGDRYLHVGDIELGRILIAREAFTAVEAWTGSSDRGDWTVVLLSASANAAAQSDHAWQHYLDTLLMVLKSHPLWRVTCESDCDQTPLERFDLTPDVLVSLLDAYRISRHYPIAFYAEFSALDPP